MSNLENLCGLMHSQDPVETRSSTSNAISFPLFQEQLNFKSQSSRVAAKRDLRSRRAFQIQHMVYCNRSVDPWSNNGNCLVSMFQHQSKVISLWEVVWMQNLYNNPCKHQPKFPKSSMQFIAIDLVESAIDQTLQLACLLSCKNSQGFNSWVLENSCSKVCNDYEQPATMSGSEQVSIIVAVDLEQTRTLTANLLTHPNPANLSSQQIYKHTQTRMYCSKARQLLWY